MTFPLIDTATGSSSATATSLATSSSFTVKVGDLVFCSYGARGTAIPSSFSDNLGNTYTLLTTNSVTAVLAGGFSIVTVAGSCTPQANFASNAANKVILASHYGGPFVASPLDRNPAVSTSASTGSIASPLTGALAQAPELRISYAAQISGTALSTVAPLDLDVGLGISTGSPVNVGTGHDLVNVIGNDFVTWTTVASSAIGIATFKLLIPALKSRDDSLGQKRNVPDTVGITTVPAAAAVVVPTTLAQVDLLSRRKTIPIFTEGSAYSIPILFANFADSLIGKPKLRDALTSGFPSFQAPIFANFSDNLFGRPQSKDLPAGGILVPQQQATQTPAPLSPITLEYLTKLRILPEFQAIPQQPMPTATPALLTPVLIDQSLKFKYRINDPQPYLQVGLPITPASLTPSFTETPRRIISTLDLSTLLTASAAQSQLPSQPRLDYTRRVDISASFVPQSVQIFYTVLFGFVDTYRRRVNLDYTSFPSPLTVVATPFIPMPESFFFNMRPSGHGGDMTINGQMTPPPPSPTANAIDRYIIRSRRRMRR